MSSRRKTKKQSKKYTVIFAITLTVVCAIGDNLTKDFTPIVITNDVHAEENVVEEVVHDEKIDVCHLDEVICPGEMQASQTETPIDTLLQQAFAPEDYTHARKIVWCESQYKQTAHNYNPATGDDSYGLAQINLLGDLFPGRLVRAKHLGYTGPETREALGEWLKIAENNIAFFASMYKTTKENNAAKNGWGPWSCHKKVTDPQWPQYEQMHKALNI